MCVLGTLEIEEIKGRTHFFFLLGLSSFGKREVYWKQRLRIRTVGSEDVRSFHHRSMESSVDKYREETVFNVTWLQDKVDWMMSFFSRPQVLDGGYGPRICFS